jgi:transposase InsO family protein
MRELYALTGVTKQAMYKYRKSELAKTTQQALVETAMKKMRKEHTRMSSRKIYFSQKEAFNIKVGRDRFEQVAFANGYRVKRKRQVHKTTYGQKVEVYPDLVTGLTINNIDQVYQSDIFYLKVAGKDYYGVTIIDVYSRKLLALHLSKTLQATENIAALKKVLNAKKKDNFNGCIFHSDRGSQYISKAHKKLLTNVGMKISMCKMPQQNAYAERVQGSIKYEYFFERTLTEKNITRKAARIKWLYNEERPHNSLNKKTPSQFEAMIEKLPESERSVCNIFKWIDDKS